MTWWLWVLLAIYVMLGVGFWTAVIVKGGNGGKKNQIEGDLLILLIFAAVAVALWPGFAMAKVFHRMM